MEWGYGSPSSFGVGSPTAPFDWGYGSPTPDGTTPYETWPTADAANEFDTGYGAPFAVIAPTVTFGGLDGAKLPGNGGVIVKLSLTTGKWPEVGPYRVRLIDPAGAVRPNDTDCYSGVPGQDTSVFTDVVNESLSFVLPPLSPGAYNVRLRYGPTFTDEILLEKVVVITRRNYASETYKIRRLYPPFYESGPIVIRSEET